MLGTFVFATIQSEGVSDAGGFVHSRQEMTGYSFVTANKAAA